MTTLPSDNLELIKRVQGSSYITVRVNNIIVFDDLETETCRIQLCLHNGDSIESTGVGMVDAIFSGLKTYYCNKYESLNDLELSNFFAKAKSKSTKSEVEVSLEVKNYYGNYFTFIDNSKSLIASATRVSSAAVEYFINSESAFFSVLEAFKDAKSRNREDLVVRYTEELTILVKNTCYTHLLEKARQYFIYETCRSKK